MLKRITLVGRACNTELAAEVLNPDDRATLFIADCGMRIGEKLKSVVPQCRVLSD